MFCWHSNSKCKKVMQESDSSLGGDVYMYIQLKIKLRVKNKK